MVLMARAAAPTFPGVWGSTKMKYTLSENIFIDREYCCNYFKKSVISIPNNRKYGVAHIFWIPKWLLYCEPHEKTINL